MLSSFIPITLRSQPVLKRIPIGIFLTRGQLVASISLAPRFNPFLFLNVDWRTNRLWLQLDQPRQFLALLRFERRYIKRKAS